jgi:multiple sugar transport system permease protein
MLKRTYKPFKSSGVLDTIWGYIMIAPMVLGLGIFFYLSLGMSFFISLTKWDILSSPEWIGWQNYTFLFNDPIFHKTLWNTIRYALMVVPLGMIVSLAMALALNTRIRFRDVYRVIYFLPVLTMPVTISIVWKWIYNPDFGPLNQFLALFGVGRLLWLSDVNLAMPALVLMNIWIGSGYGMVIFLAGLQNIPREFYEAAEVDGANYWQKLIHITLPLLTPTLFFSSITSLISAFQVFDVIFTMTKGGPLDSTRTMVYTIYDNGFHFGKMGLASATAWVLFAIILVVTIIQFWSQKKWVHYS